MDDFFEVLIYLLFIAVSVIGGIYKNYAKKKEEEARRQRQLENAKTIHPSEKQFEPKTENKTIPSSLEDFLKQQFEIETEPEIITDELDQEPEHYDTAMAGYSGKNNAEGEAVFKDTSDTIISDNLNDSDFSIASASNDEFDQTDIIKEEEKAFRSVDDDIEKESILEEFDLQQAVIFSEILKRPYQD